MLGLFSREHFNFKELSLEQTGVYRSLSEILRNLEFSHPKSQDQT